VTKFVAVGTVCAYPKFTPVPFREDDLWNGYPEETNAPYGLAKKMLLVQAQAYRQQYGFNAIYLLPVNLYGPRDNFDPAELARHPGADPQVPGGRARRREDRGLGRRLADARVPLRRRRRRGHPAGRRALRRSEPVNLGSAFEISIKDLAETIARLTGFEGPIVWDTSKPNGQPRRKLSRRRELAACRCWAMCGRWMTFSSASPFTK
jgi:GDP-L-fucose synthase